MIYDSISDMLKKPPLRFNNSPSAHTSQNAAKMPPREPFFRKSTCLRRTGNNVLRLLDAAKAKPYRADAADGKRGAREGCKL